MTQAIGAPRTAYVIRHRAGDNGIGNDTPMFLRHSVGYWPGQLERASIFATLPDAILAVREAMVADHGEGDTLTIHTVEIRPGLRPDFTLKNTYRLGPEVWPDVVGGLAHLA